MRARVSQPRQVRDLPRDRAKEVRELRRFRRRDPDASKVVLLGRGERLVAEAVDGLPEQEHFTRARVDEAANLVDDLASRAIALGASRVWHDAEAAALVAALHRR